MTYLPATLIVPYQFRLYGFCVADITAFTTLSKNVGDKTAVAAKLAKRTCLGDMSATFRRHMQLRWRTMFAMVEARPMFAVVEVRALVEVEGEENDINVDMG